MKTKVLILLGLCIQCLFLIFWLFRVPEISGQLKVAQNELQQGGADLPGLTIRNADSTETIIAYDPSKSASENIVARAKARLTIANSEYKSIAVIPLLAGLFNVVLLIILLWSCRAKSTAAPS
jgi:hypothetical protein